jgi:DNA-binding beta-propeller fold protein YncE
MTQLLQRPKWNQRGRLAALLFVGVCVWSVASGSCPAAERLVLVAGGQRAEVGIPALEAKLITPFGVDFDRRGNTFLVEMNGQRVLKIDSAGLLHLVAGDGQQGNRGDGRPATEAQFNGMHSLAVAPNGDLYLADTWNNRARKIDARAGIITPVAGTGEKGFSGDGGPAVQARFGGIYCVALDRQAQRLYLTDLNNKRIRAVDLASGVVTTVAGNGAKGVPEDGTPAIEAPLVDPRASVVDSRGNLYVLERGGHALRVMDAQTGQIRTVVGTGEPGSAGDGGDARQAQLKGPKHLCVDAEDNVIIADTDNHVIRKYLPREGRIVRIAGSGRKGTAGVGGPPLEAELNQPHGVALRDGRLYIVDSFNHRLLTIEQQ